MLCAACGYAANRQIATFQKPEPESETPLARELVETPGAKTIEALAAMLEIPTGRTAKAVFLMATQTMDDEDQDRLVMAIVRGDMELNETKLANAIQAKALRPAREEEIEAAGAVPGFASPIGLDGILVAVDDLIPASPNLVAGANKVGYHERNVNFGRDFAAEIVADLAAAQEGDPCPRCGEPLQASRGVEVGNIFKLGTRYSANMGATYLDEQGQERPVVMGSYGIGTGRLLACVAEEHHDDDGLIWPVTVAPFDVHLLALLGGEQTAESLMATLEADGIEVLYDDRDETPGVKFADADLIGLPLRLTVSQRSLEAGGVELKRRDRDEKLIVAVEAAPGAVAELLAEMQAEILARVVEEPFDED
jgi:prolyl-tRNA synthetase